jgi:hypothetical protein
MPRILVQTLILTLFSLGWLFPNVTLAKDLPPENKKTLKEMNNLLVDYFKANCKGKDDSSTCPILKDLKPKGKFNTVIAKDYVKNYHFWVFNDKWIWVGHGLFTKLIGKVLENLLISMSKVITHM